MNKLFSLVAIFATVVMAAREDGKEDGKPCSQHLGDKSTKADRSVKTDKKASQTTVRNPIEHWVRP